MSIVDYIVQPGEGLFMIASKLVPEGTSKEERNEFAMRLAVANGGDLSMKLYPGRILRYDEATIPGWVEPEPEPEPPPSGGGGGTIVVIEDGGGYKYPLDVRSNYSPSLNAQNIRSGTQKAHEQGRFAEFPPGLLMVDTNPFLSSGQMVGMGWWGQGDGHTKLRFPNTSAEKWMYRDDDAYRLSFCSFHHLSFEAGPRDTKDQRLIYYPQHFGFRFQGLPEQKLVFDSCAIAGMAGVLDLPGSNNSSEVTFSDCQIDQVYDWGVRFDNQQALNITSRDSHWEGVFGPLFWFIDSGGRGFGGGGQVNVRGGNILVQHYGEHRGTLFRFDAKATATCYVQTRIEVRDDASLVDHVKGVCNVLFQGGSAYTTRTTGDVQVVDIGNEGQVHFDHWVMEHNGSRPRFKVRPNGVLTYLNSPVRGDLRECITVESGGKSRGANNYVRYSNVPYPEWNIGVGDE